MSEKMFRSYTQAKAVSQCNPIIAVRVEWNAPNKRIARIGLFTWRIRLSGTSSSELSKTVQTTL